MIIKYNLIYAKAYSAFVLYHELDIKVAKQVEPTDFKIGRQIFLLYPLKIDIIMSL